MKRKIIIVGTAPCLEADLAELFAMSAQADYDFMAIGLDCATRYLGHIDHVATYHPEDLDEFRKHRESAGANLDYIGHSHKDQIRRKGEIITYPVDRVWPYMKPSGSSSMLGVEVAIGLGYEKIIIAGGPLDEKRYRKYRIGWQIRFAGKREDYVAQIKSGTFGETVINSLYNQKDKVRAMSGYPRELLGAPTREWLNDQET